MKYYRYNKKDITFYALLFLYSVAALMAQPLFLAFIALFLLLNVLSSWEFRLREETEKFNYMKTNLLEKVDFLLAKLENNYLNILEKLPQKKELLSDGQRGKVTILVDASNLYYPSKKLGKKIDYKKLKFLLTQNSTQLLNAFFFASIDRNNPKELNFLKLVESYGYQLITNPLVEYKNGGKEANLDPQIMIEMIRSTQISNTIVLLTGDGDFVEFVHFAKANNCRVEVYSFAGSTNTNLRQVADKYTDLEGLDVFIP